LSQNQKMVQKILLSLFACIMVCSEGLAQRARFEGTGIDDFFSLQSAPQLPSLPTPPQNLTFPGAGAVQPRAILTPPTFQQPFTQPGIFQQAPIFQNTPAPSLPALPSFNPFNTGTQPFPVFPSAPQNLQLPPNLQPRAQVAPHKTNGPTKALEPTGYRRLISRGPTVSGLVSATTFYPESWNVRVSGRLGFTEAPETTQRLVTS